MPPSSNYKTTRVNHGKTRLWIQGREEKKMGLPVSQWETIASKIWGQNIWKKKREEWNVLRVKCEDIFFSGRKCKGKYWMVYIHLSAYVAYYSTMKMKVAGSYKTWYLSNSIHNLTSQTALVPQDHNLHVHFSEILKSHIFPNCRNRLLIVLVECFYHFSLSFMPVIRVWCMNVAWYWGLLLTMFEYIKNMLYWYSRTDMHVLLSKLNTLRIVGFWTLSIFCYSEQNMFRTESVSILR
jgi:hypothetical protein